MKYIKLLFVVCCSLAPLSGCDTGVATEEIKTASADDALFEPKSLLERYAAGQQMGSEATSFEYMVNRVKESDPAKAEILAKGFEDLKSASAGARKKKAKEILDALGG